TVRHREGGNRSRLLPRSGSQSEPDSSDSDPRPDSGVETIRTKPARPWRSKEGVRASNLARRAKTGAWGGGDVTDRGSTPWHHRCESRGPAINWAGIECHRQAAKSSENRPGSTTKGRKRIQP